MDTLTQITLGAACGEAVLGRKIGNRAMVWGAFGGLLPDLDVAANLFTSEINALAFHRGFMHSLLFAVLAAFGLSWLVSRLYQTGHYRKRWYKLLVFSFILFLLIVVSGGLVYVTFSPEKGVNVPVLLIAVAAFVLASWLIWKKYYIVEWAPATATGKEWFWLFFLSVSTHILLDCFTSYGTQVFQPFTNTPVAFSTIAVIDPLYTLPFIICILIASTLWKEDRRRRLFNWLGILISSAYLAFTVYNKQQVDRIFNESLARQHIPAMRFTTFPTMFNNFLWQGVAEGDSAYYHAMFSLFDDRPYVPEFTVINKTQEALQSYEGTREMEILKWFTWGYYTISQVNDHHFQLNVVRYGSDDGTFDAPADYAFRFLIDTEKEDLDIHQLRSYHRITWKEIRQQFERIKGRQ